MAKILIVEDDETLAEMYHSRLVVDGFEISKAINGEEALKILRVLEHDLILLDIMLPKVDGLSVLEQLRSSSWPNKNKPVIIFSVLAQPQDVERARKLGANDYLVKGGVTPNEVVAKIREHLK